MNAEFSKFFGQRITFVADFNLNCGDFLFHISFTVYSCNFHYLILLKHITPHSSGLVYLRAASRPPGSPLSSLLCCIYSPQCYFTHEIQHIIWYCCIVLSEFLPCCVDVVNNYILFPRWQSNSTTSRSSGFAQLSAFITLKYFSTLITYSTSRLFHFAHL